MAEHYWEKEVRKQKDCYRGYHEETHRDNYIRKSCDPLFAVLVELNTQYRKEERLCLLDMSPAMVTALDWFNASQFEYNYEEVDDSDDDDDEIEQVIEEEVPVSEVSHVEEEKDAPEKVFSSEIHAFPIEVLLLGGGRNGGRRVRGGRRKLGRGPPRRFGRRNLINVPKQTVIEPGGTVSRVTRLHKDLLRIPKLHFMTEAVVVDFTFRDAVMTHTNNGVSYVSWTYAINDLEDVTPSGNEAIPGVTAWSTFFGKYKVLKTTYSIDIGNMEDGPCQVVAWPSLTDLGVNSSTVTQAFGRWRAFHRSA